MTELAVLVNSDGMVSSKLVAEKFQRRHADVLSSIRNTLLEIPNDFNKRNFSFVDNTRENQRGEHSEVFMTRDGFSLLAMGFTGQAAMKWKVYFLEAFNAMEETIKAEIPTLKATIARMQQEKLALPPPKKPHGNKGLVSAILVENTLFGTECLLKKVPKDDPRVSDAAKLEGKARQMMSISCGMQQHCMKIYDHLSLLKRK